MANYWGLAATALVCAMAQPARAADKVLYQPAPDWILAPPPIDTAKLGADAPLLVVLDGQQRLQDGQVWGYLDIATRVPNEQALASVSSVQFPWQPSQGDLIVHSAEILRGPTRIDLLKGGDPFTVLRREERLARRELTGVLTATMTVPGLQVGDVVRFRISITRRDPTLKGDVQTSSQLIAAPVKAGFARSRLLWPVASDIKWRVYAEGVTAQPATTGGYRDLVVMQPLAKPADVPTDAPARYQPFPAIEATSFADWPAVSKVMAPLYATDGTIAPGSTLAAEVARIERATADPSARAALALRLVQDKVSYLLLGMETGNYVPQSPAATWDARYGDCKAKTLLLLAILHALKIEAEPVLASVKSNAVLDRRLPSAGAFDHVLVRATIAGESLWLDGTDVGARPADLRDTPALGQVLPLRPGGAGLMPIVLRPSGRPSVTTEIALDQSAGVRLPAAFTMAVTVRGGVAEQLRGVATQGTEEQVDTIVDKLAVEYIGGSASLTTRKVDFDPATGTAVVRATGVSYPEWDNDNGRLRYGVDKAVGTLDFKPDRARAAWRTIPVRTADPETAVRIVRIKLPPATIAGFAIDGPTDFADTLAGQRITRTVTRVGDEVTIRETAVATGAEIAPADIAAARQKIAVAKAKLPTLLAAADYPPEWREISVANQAGRTAPLLAIYDAQVKAAPDKAEAYGNRAWFRERVYDRKGAVADLDRAIALEPTVERYADRSSLHTQLGQPARALADAEAAYALDPSADRALYRLSYVRATNGRVDQAVELVQPKIDADGTEKTGWMSQKATLLSLGGDSDNALATLDDAIALKPREAALYNNRCWIAGTGNVQLDRALGDCNRAVELAGDSADYIDSRAMVHFRAGRLAEAKADLDTALSRAPDQATSLYLRGVIARRQGQVAAADADQRAARLIDPDIDVDFRRWKIVP